MRSQSDQKSFRVQLPGAEENADAGNDERNQDNSFPAALLGFDSHHTVASEDRWLHFNRALDGKPSEGKVTMANHWEFRTRK